MRINFNQNDINNHKIEYSIVINTYSVTKAITNDTLYFITCPLAS